MRIKNSFIYLLLKSLYGSSFDFFKFRPFSYISKLIGVFFDYQKFKKTSNSNIVLPTKFYLCLLDKTSHTPVEPTYFYQDTWLAQKIFELKPRQHFDVGSSVPTIGIISQFVPTTFVYIRPIDVKLNGLTFQQGSILDLPFGDNSIESISAMCVLEHIGLGRYGDPIDSFGSEKAIVELVRVTKKGGYILISVPVAQNNFLYFNAHRAFTRDTIVSLFDSCELIEEKYQYGMSLFDEYDESEIFGTGLFMFKKMSYGVV